MFVCEFVVWKNYIPFITLTQNGKLSLYCQINRFEWLAVSYNPITSMQNADTDCSCSFNRLICVICPSSCMNKEVCNIKSVWKQHSNLSTEFINRAISIEDDWYIVWHHPDLILKWALRINEPSQHMHVKKKTKIGLLTSYVFVASDRTTTSIRTVSVYFLCNNNLDSTCSFSRSFFVFPRRGANAAYANIPITANWFDFIHCDFRIVHPPISERQSEMNERPHKKKPP